MVAKVTTDIIYGTFLFTRVCNTFTERNWFLPVTASKKNFNMRLQVFLFYVNLIKHDRSTPVPFHLP